MLIRSVGRTALVLIALHSFDDELLARVNVEGIPELHRAERGRPGTGRDKGSPWKLALRHFLGGGSLY